VQLSCRLVSDVYHCSVELLAPSRAGVVQCQKRTHFGYFRQIRGRDAVAMMIGYARVSTAEQNLALQLDALRAVGCSRIFQDRSSGSIRERPQLTRALNHLRPGDTLVTWRLDRLGRSLHHLITLMKELNDVGVAFRSLSESIDTATASGRLLFHVMGALAEFERSLISERTKAGMASAKLRGKRLGRPPSNGCG
jgi:DNA invertase Pin-like site-specific DNA recombinase